MTSFRIIPSVGGIAFVLGLICASSIRIAMAKKSGAACSAADSISLPPNDGTVGGMKGAGALAEFNYNWLANDGTVYPDKASGRLEVAATLAITPEELKVAISIVSKMIRNMPAKVFAHLASEASVGLFTVKDKMTIFPEYSVHKDRPECAGGNCKGACSNTCTGDGRKYDSLAGVGGRRTTCLDDNFMCTAADPYRKTYSVLVHEFAHTIHQYGLKNVTDYFEKISQAYKNALGKNIWDRNSYAMSNELEYFAEGTTAFFNNNRLCQSSGGMNRCGNPDGFCKDEEEARKWLQTKDPLLFEALSYTFTNNRPTIPSGLATCVVL